MSEYRISKVARTSGFSVTTLRYYERLGLLPAPGRTESGYRIYDDRAIRRLAFIARLKGLGLDLEDIRGLADVWEQDRCAPVQARLLRLVDDKVAETRARITELRDFADELAAIAPRLESDLPNGACDDGCACGSPSTSSGGSPRASASSAGSPRRLRVIKASDPAIACSLDQASAADRALEWRAVSARAMVRELLPDGARLRFGSDIAVTDIAGLVALERVCCGFLTFTMTLDQSGLHLSVRGPSGALGVIDELIGLDPSRR